MLHRSDITSNEPSLNKMFESEEIFHLGYLVSYVHCNLKSCMAKVIIEIIIWLFAHSLPCLTHECNIGPGDRPQAILALALVPILLSSGRV